MPPAVTGWPSVTVEPSAGSAMVTPNSRPLSGIGAGSSTTFEAWAPSKPKAHELAPMSCTWKVSASPGSRGVSRYGASDMTAD